MVSNPKPVEPPELSNGRERGPMIGHMGAHEERFQAVCPKGQFVVGLEGRRDKLVRDIAVRCSTVKTTVDRKTGQTLFTWLPRESQIVGKLEDRGQRFSLACPADSVVTGAVGRNGQHVDAVGIGCQRTHDLTEMP
jgi:hypothetical protein